ncbi:anhydro-N-acetylmuramic acid kinase [Myxacorys almedinensis]|uniref:Anhydro-N-acetylmuramic acid kinase n=1 Tax=Myxacorys almedinensis A TaxID=2690445 RepID=A0A8J8CJI2_9CYAN|nr:anhydro-N-acetylmuramic acid kinase [Myxacorys almedinensis]NDJ19023.1 anhydro-N-acetylmuramic acid kinase [Myxacorys almedinensis A]
MRVIGLISGTSVDGIDAALVEISGSGFDLQAELIKGATYPYPAALQQQILGVGEGEAVSMPDLADLDDRIAAQFAQAAIAIQAHHPKADLIGSHGQTVFHRPPDRRNGLQLGYSMQLGRGEAIAHLTQIPTVSNFRAADIALGGQGAPLVPPVDAALFRHQTYDRCVQNIGGIGNLTYLPAKDSERSTKILGWDTGPGNMLLDLAVQHLSNGEKTFDDNGAWAATGTPDRTLVDHWLQQAYFQAPPPKSTGREHFGQAYLEQCLLDARDLNAADLLATLTDLTAATIAHSYKTFLPRLPDQVLICGGGSRNAYLKQRIQTHLSECTVLTTDDVGLNADFKEAIAFAVLAYWRHHHFPGNLPEVTGATRAVFLGEIYHVP